MNETLQSFYRRQKVLADFGDFALQSESLDEILTEACRLVASALDTQRAKILEIESGSDSLLVRAGVGWGKEVVGRLRIPMDVDSSETYAIGKREPVIVTDLAKEERFDFPAFMREEGVVSLANVPIFLPGHRAFGLLQIDDTKPREFDQNDTEFLRTYATILGPVIDRLFKLDALRSSEERFRLTVEQATDYAIFITDADDRITDWLPGAAEVFGWRAQEIIGQSGAVLFTPEDRENGQPEKEVETARQDGVAPNVRWHRRKDGTRVFIDGSVRALWDRVDGRLTGFLKIGQDVTDQRAGQDRQHILLAELQHRTRNLMAVVRLVAEQTLRSSDTLEQFARTFRDRINSLARVQDLFARLQEGSRVTFDQLLESEINALGGSPDIDNRVTLEGPRGVPLRSGSVQITAMVIHELCTNALKYGALGQVNARLEIRWRVGEEDGQPWIYIEWVETGIAEPPHPRVPHGSGAGRELIERALPYQVGARTSLEFLDDGLRCTIAMPVSKAKANAKADG